MTLSVHANPHKLLIFTEDIYLQFSGWIEECLNLFKILFHCHEALPGEDRLDLKIEDKKFDNIFTVFQR